MCGIVRRGLNADGVFVAELVAVGEKGSAIQHIHVLFVSRRLKQWSKAVEDLMLLLVDLCVEQRKSKQIRDALVQYRGLTQVRSSHHSPHRATRRPFEITVLTSLTCLHPLLHPLFSVTAALDFEPPVESESTVVPLTFAARQPSHSSLTSNITFTVFFLPERGLSVSVVSFIDDTMKLFRSFPYRKFVRVWDSGLRELCGVCVWLPHTSIALLLVSYLRPYSDLLGSFPFPVYLVSEIPMTSVW